MITTLGRANDRYYLDLENRGVINYAQMNAIQNTLPKGWDNEAISIAIKNR